MSFASRPRHPVTGRRFWLRASTDRELAAFLHRVDSLRVELRLGMRTADEIDRELRHLRFGPVTLERAANAYLARPQLSPNTRRGIRSAMAGHLAPLLPKPIAALDVATLSAWAEHIGRELAASSLGTVWRKLTAIVRYASERGWIGAAPWGAWRPSRSSGSRGRPRRDAARSVGEFVSLIHAARTLDRNVYTGLEAKILVAGLLGLRQGELAGLEWDDVIFGDPIIIVVARQWDAARRPKGQKPPARIESIPELSEGLERHREELRARGLFAENGPVFPRPKSPPGKPGHYAHGEVLTRLHIRKAVALAGLPNVRSWSAHSLRDTFVTLEAEAAGGDLRRVQARSRHVTLASLAKYLRALSRNHPASPALAELPGLRAAGDAGSRPVPLPASRSTSAFALSAAQPTERARFLQPRPVPPKETPP